MEKRNCPIRAAVLIFLGIAVLFTEWSCRKMDLPSDLMVGGEILSAPTKTTTSLSPLADLGKKLFQDPLLSQNDTAALDPMLGYIATPIQSCESCHSPAQGFAARGNYEGLDPSYLRKFINGFAEGATPGRFGGRIAPTASYATFSPVMFTRTVTTANNGNGEAEVVGGLFWDGRATGLRLNSPAAEQALGPFLSTVEMNVHDVLNPTVEIANKKEVLKRIYSRSGAAASGTYYEDRWQKATGSALRVGEADMPTDQQINDWYDQVGKAIAAYEGSIEVNKFTSKYDDYLAKKVKLTSLELQGLNLFTNNVNNAGTKQRGAGCFGCHALNSPFTTARLFTDFAYDNIGVPAAPDAFGNMPAKDGGIGAMLQANMDNPLFPAAVKDPLLIARNFGSFKTPTLRNVAKGETATGGPFGRRYMHNGVFNSLDQVVHFYNTRDLVGIFDYAGWPVDEATGKAIPGVTQPWGPTDYPATMKKGDVGNLLLTWQEEKALVAFLRTLSDK